MATHREREHRLTLGRRFWETFINSSRKIIYYLKSNKRTEISDDQNRFRDTVVRLTDFTGTGDEFGRNIFYGITTFLHDQEMFFRAEYHFNYYPDHTEETMDILISSNPEKLGGSSHF